MERESDIFKLKNSKFVFSRWNRTYAIPIEIIQELILQKRKIYASCDINENSVIILHFIPSSNSLNIYPQIMGESPITITLHPEELVKSSENVEAEAMKRQEPIHREKERSYEEILVLQKSRQKQRKMVYPEGFYRERGRLESSSDILKSTGGNVNKPETGNFEDTFQRIQYLENHHGKGKSLEELEELEIIRIRRLNERKWKIESYFRRHY